MQNIINLDQEVFHWFNSVVGQNQFLDTLVKIIAVYVVYLIPLLFLFFWFYKKNEKTQKFLLQMFITSVISWEVIARIVGMLINRPRPEGFAGTKELMFHPPTYAFPSDHALFLAFLTTYLFLNGYKKWGYIALVVTFLVSISRVIAGFHWPGDILAGWIFGAVLAYGFYALRKYIDAYLVSPLYRLAKILHLA